MIDYDPSQLALFHPESRDTVFQPGRVYSELQLAAEASRLAYYRGDTQAPDQRRLTDALAGAGFRAPVWLEPEDDGTGAAGFAARRDDGLALIAFRGTEPDNIANIGTDLDASLTPWGESSGRAHAGFARATRALAHSVNGWLAAEAIPASKLILTGHSLGAAIATLMATQVVPQWLITLGSPRVGNAQLASTVRPAVGVRFVNCCDIVTLLPPPIGGYVHVGDPRYITRDGIADPPGDCDVEQDRLEARADYLATQAWRSGNLLFRDLADHAPINYLRALF